jgi:hypothetical protein
MTLPPHHEEVLMTWLKRAAVTVSTIAVVVAFAAVAGADQWNDRTTLKFDAPMMIPGATLPPGTYTFKLMDSGANRHMVHIYNEDGSKLIASTQAVPTKRMEPRGDVVLKLNPTEAGAPAAIKAWFYPGSLYGHEFVYPDRQAREIAQRTKTLVLSGDAEEGMGKGTLHNYDADGRKTARQDDEQLNAEWRKWSDEGRRQKAAKVAAPGTPDTRESTAPAMRHDPAGMTVSIGDLEEKASQYIGKTINVTAEVEDVFGPRLFKIDEPNWGDLDGEILVYLPSDLAALVRENDRVTVTGTMKMFVQADLDKELGWLEPDPDVEVEFAKRPVLVASRIVGGDSNVALAIRASAPSAAASGAVGTSGAAGSSSGAVTDAAAIARGDDELVGRQVDLDGVKVTRAAKQHGFWIEAGGRNVFVLPAQHAQRAAASAGATVSIDGVVLSMPRSLRDKVRADKSGNDAIYVYATALK